MKQPSGILPLPIAKLTRKPIRFLGSSRQDLRDMPVTVRHAIGEQLMTLQLGDMPVDYKPMPSVGAGAYEIRVRDAAGAFRAMYVTKFPEAIYVLHVFQKKSRTTERIDIKLARQRYKQIPGARS